jgi:hypothetical protein
MTEKSETPGMQFKDGDEVSIMRGLHRNETARVIGVNAGQQEYAVRFTDGSFGLINAVNVRAPEEPSITASQLAAMLGNYIGEIPTNLLDEIAAALPGIDLALSK